MKIKLPGSDEELNLGQKYEFNNFGNGKSPMGEKSYLKETLQSCDESDELSWNDSDDSLSDKKVTTRSYKSGKQSYKSYSEILK